MTNVWYVEVDGHCCLLTAISENQARREARLDYGRNAEVGAVRLATSEDIAWVSSMGGFVPEAVRSEVPAKPKPSPANSHSVWVGQVDDDLYRRILTELTPAERLGALRNALYTKKRTGAI